MTQMIQISIFAVAPAVARVGCAKATSAHQDLSAVTPGAGGSAALYPQNCAKCHADDGRAEAFRGRAILPSRIGKGERVVIGKGVKVRGNNARETAS